MKNIMNKKKDIRPEDILIAVNDGFTAVEGRLQTLDSDISGMKKDMVWVKDILEKHTGFLQRLDEERIFTLSYVTRLEKEIEFIKKRLKIA